MMQINVGKDFSRTPGGRYIKDGPDSGQLFRERHLVPLLRQAIANSEQLVVNLDGPRGYLASFIEEAFGGLIRYGTFTHGQLNAALAIVAKDFFYKPYQVLAKKSIAEAKPESVAKAG